MSDFYIAHEVKRVEVMLKHRGFKVDYTVNGGASNGCQPFEDWPLSDIACLIVDMATRAEEVEGETE